MKKLIVVLILVMGKLYSQQAIIFKVAYKPELAYTQSVVSTSYSEMKYLGSTELLKKLEEKGIENPKETFDKTYIKSINTTGKLKNGKFPIQIRFIGGDGAIIPDGTLIFGTVTSGETPALDSINAPKMKDEEKQALFQGMKSMISQITLPEKTVKIGESFTREIPLKIPVGKFTFDLQNTIIYTLKSIEKSRATFDIIQNYTFKSLEAEKTMEANGSGSGKLIYDIDNSFYLTYQLNSIINMTMSQNNITFKVTSKSEFVQNTEIEKQ